MTALVGCQSPRINTLPKRVHDVTDGEEACVLAAAYGMAPDDWQRDFVLPALARAKNGKLAAGIAGQAVPRQNGKNGEIEIIELHKMVMQGRKILHTAHEVKTARKAFIRLKSFFENERKYPELAALVAEIRKTNGQEAVVLTNGGSCEFSARSKGAARGFTVDDLVCDEAQELTDDQLAALLPTISAAPSGDPQQYYFGTPPAMNMLGEVFRRVRAAGVAGKNPRQLWQEWSIPDDVDPHDALRDWKENAYATNPALGVRLNLQTVIDEKTSMSPEAFCRERLGQWLSKAKSGPFPAGTWEAGIDPLSEIEAGSPLAWAVEVSVNRSVSHIVVAGFREDGLPHVEVVASRAGVEWVPGWFSDRTEQYGDMAVVVQKNGAPSSGLIPDLEAIEGVTVHPWAGGELGAWTGRFFDLVAKSKADPRDGLAHLPQPVLDLAAVDAVLVYLAGGAPVIDRKRGTVDVTPLVGAVEALGKLLERDEVPKKSVYEQKNVSVMMLS